MEESGIELWEIDEITLSSYFWEETLMRPSRVVDDIALRDAAITIINAHGLVDAPGRAVRR